MVAVIPVTVRIGEGGGKAESMFKVLARLEYLGEDEAGRGGAEEEPKDTRENPKRQHTKLGRCLELPVTLAVRRMLRVRSCAFSTSDVIRTRSVEVRGPRGTGGGGAVAGTGGGRELRKQQGQGSLSEGRG